ncbi:MAG: methyltransferase family protein [Pseudoalteromonas spongiae]
MATSSGSAWNIDNTVITILLQVFHILGWLVMVAATFEIDHFHLMGLKQSITTDVTEGKKLKESFLYSIVRHPIQTGVLMGVWSTAYMSMTQFLLSIGLTFYIVVGLYFEEKSLIAHFGETYLNYKKRVPAVIPFWPTH